MNENNQLNRVRATLYGSFDYQLGEYWCCDNNRRVEVETWEYLEAIV